MSALVSEIERCAKVRGLTIPGLAMRAFLSPSLLYKRLAKPETFTLGELLAVVKALGWSREKLIQGLAMEINDWR